MDIRTELDNFLGEKRALVDAIAREFRAGTPAKEIARTVAPAFSRDQVTQYLSAVALADKARKALDEAGLAFAADVLVSGIDTPREARLIPAADPEETPTTPPCRRGSGTRCAPSTSPWTCCRPASTTKTPATPRSTDSSSTASPSA